MSLQSELKVLIAGYGLREIIGVLSDLCQNQADTLVDLQLNDKAKDCTKNFFLLNELYDKICE